MSTYPVEFSRLERQIKEIQAKNNKLKTEIRKAKLINTENKKAWSKIMKHRRDLKEDSPFHAL